MRKQYIQPEIQLHRMNPESIVCIGSVTTEEGITYGGGSNGSDPNQKPF